MRFALYLLLALALYGAGYATRVAHQGAAKVAPAPVASKPAKRSTATRLAVNPGDTFSLTLDGFAVPCSVLNVIPHGRGVIIEILPGMTK